MYYEQKVNRIEHSAQDSIEEVSWKKKLPQLHKVPQHAYLNFAHQAVLTSSIVFLHKTQLSKLLQMMLGDAGAAEMQGFLDFSGA